MLLTSLNRFFYMIYYPEENANIVKEMLEKSPGYLIHHRIESRVNCQFWDYPTLGLLGKQKH